MRPMSELEATAARLVVLKIVDSNVWGYVVDVLENKIAQDMVQAKDAAAREEVAAEYRVCTKFINSLVETANQVRGS
jgi:hypothetical protein